MNQKKNNPQETKNMNNQNQQPGNQMNPQGREQENNPTQNPNRNPDEISRSMKNQNRANNVSGRAQQTNVSGSSESTISRD